MTMFGAYSLKKTDELLRYQLVLNIEDLHYRYKAEIDHMRRDYQENLIDLRMNKMVELKKLEDQGVNVRKLDKYK